jgi:hypothetical protein
VAGTLEFQEKSRPAGVAASPCTSIRAGRETPRCAELRVRQVTSSDILLNCSRFHTANLGNPGCEPSLNLYLHHVCPLRRPPYGSHSHCAKTAALPPQPPEQHTP